MTEHTDLKDQIKRYIQSGAIRQVPGWKTGAPFEIALLAQGEYNINYRVRQQSGQWVFRVNTGSQIKRDDQILYEFRALQLLQHSGLTPRPYHVDDSRTYFSQGISVMEFLPGETLRYETDSLQVAGLFAGIHGLEIDAGENHLIREELPLSMTCEECATLLPVYLDSPLADPGLRDYLREVLSWAGEARSGESWFASDPWPCVINTEVNSGNFIVNRETGRIFLVDWEKPLWGDPSQDLSHFCAPMTTLWKTGFRMSGAQKQCFLEHYKKNIADRHLRDTIEERVRLRDPFNYLRGISWSAMAWVNYQTGDHALRNRDTFEKVSSYLNLEFQRELFDPFLKTP